MQKKEMRKRIAILTVAALCLSILPFPQMSSGQVKNTYIEDWIAVDEEASPECTADIVYLEDSDIQYPEKSMPPYTWNDGEEVVVELDDQYKDDNGFEYTLYGPSLTATLKAVDLSLYSDEEQEIVLKIPDKVRKGEREYTVTCISVKTTGLDRGNQLVRLYIGKNVSVVDLQYFDRKVVSYVHEENESFISDSGSLLSSDKTVLYRFCDETYDSGSSYILPRQLEHLDGNAFYKADIEEVTFNDKLITTSNGREFYHSYVRKVNLNKLTRIAPSFFSGCPFLKEVILCQEGIEIDEWAFHGTKSLENIYIPPKAKLRENAFSESGLKTVVMGEDVDFDTNASCTNLFDKCYNLQTVILPDAMSIFPASTFRYCLSLCKLHVPEQLSRIEEDCFSATTINLYGKKGSVAQEVTNEKVQFISLENHEHQLEEVTFFAFETWAVTGKYCSECGYGTECRRMELTGQTDRDNLPAMLVSPDADCSDKQGLEDSSGLIYELNPDTMTATVKGMEQEEGILAKQLYVPESVEKDGQTYIVDTIGFGAYLKATLVVLPDTIVSLEGFSFAGEIEQLGLGDGISHIDDAAFQEVCVGHMAFRIKCDNFTCDDGVLYDRNQTKLIKFSRYHENKITEFTVPDTVTKIVSGAFRGCGSDTGLTRITITDKEKIEIGAQAFDGCDAYINYIETPVTPTPTPTSSPVPSPTPTPSSSPVISTEIPVTTEKPGQTVPSETLTSDSKDDVKAKEKLQIMKFRVSTKDNQTVKIGWSSNKNVTLYQIFRSEKKTGKYQLIGNATGSKVSYVDKKVTPLKKYYYKMKAVGKVQGSKIEGEYSKVRSISVSGVETPKISLRKGQLNGIKYITVALKRYQGQYADIYISVGEKKYEKLKLISNKIAKYRGEFKIRYVVKHKTIRFKVRTYKKKGKKKVYSNFSKVVQVQV